MPHNKIHSKQRAWLSSQDIENLVLGLNDDEPVYPERVLTALSRIIAIIHSSYECQTDPLQESISQIIQILQTRPVNHQDMEISKSALAKKPLLMQLIIQLQDIVIKQHHTRSSKQLIWLAIALHTSLLLTHLKVATHANNILMQFKLSQFSESPNRTWIWRSLPDVPSLNMNINDILSIFRTILDQQENSLSDLENRDAIDLLRSKENKSDVKARLSQIQKITLAYQNANFLKSKTTNSKKSKAHKKIKTKIKPIKLDTSNAVNYPLNKEPDPYYWDTSPNDIEIYIPKLDIMFFEAEIEKHDGLETSVEEKIDHYDRPYINYSELPDPLINHSIPLQAIDITLQQNYMSQRDLNLNSNTRLLSLAGYQSLFSALSHDAKACANESEKSAASLLLLSMLTVLPIKSLIIPGYIGHTSVFSVGISRAYIKHHLGATKRSKKFDEEIFENEFDEVKIPLPLWLIEYLSSNELPTKKTLTTYLSKLRTSLQLPYLSINRIETALQIILSRYTPNCHGHIADIICRVPAPHAPAMYYSSHTSEELITHYKAALNKLNINKSFDLSYITAWHKYTLGSAFAFKLDYVRKFMANLQAWVKHSPNADTHFNRTSILVWFIFCILTGVRPNNGIGTISDIDLETGWLLVCDKPSKNVQNHRLVPLCSTLIRYLIDYKAYLIDYQLRHPLKHKVSECVDKIRLGEDVALLRLLSDSADRLKDIKRGDAYQMTHEILDADPYWTRHFVRTQLEKYGVNLVLINTVIGHERGRQEALGQLSSSSKSKIKRVGVFLEYIANLLELSTVKSKTLHYYGEPSNA
ncbi:hypothetical protein [Psychrobacter sanguinis]|uniref:hypothetical protein n=1 Tax=Psychrobacter sanguinis TaxID=861445 RepID=UPI002A758660|nr:hypothetical protein [Psychrobacter sanguinis]MDY3305865.1 hypothetical protein [Psychrobacter sanguinis]